MTGEVRMGGGFNGSATSQMSPSLLRQIALQEEAEARKAAEELRKREERAEEWQTRAVTAAIQDAMDRGEEFNPRMLDGRGLGHTPAEFVALVSARQDHEDMQAAARERQAFEAWKFQESVGTSADVSAPTPVELAEQATMAARVEAFRARRREQAKVIQAARTLARMDRERR
jgi:hypothetical protein